jgi:hypothetical protein
MRMNRGVGWIVFGFVIAGSGAARAQAADTPGSGSGSDDAAEVERALAADLAAQKEAAPAETTTAATAPTGPAAAQSMNPDLSFIADFALASFSAPSLEAGDHDPHEDGFTLQALELAASKAVDPYFKFNVNLAFSNDGVEIEEAYATTLELPYNLQVRAGKFLTQFGRINPTHPHAWDFSDEPFLLSRLFGGEGNRGVGVEVTYLTPLPWYVELGGAVIDPRGEGTSRSFLAEPDATIDQATDVQALVTAKQFFELDDNWSLLWGLSYTEGPHGGLALRSHIVGTDVYLKYRPITYGSYTIVSLQSEWAYRRREEASGAIADVNGYAQLFWRFDQRWATAARYEYGSPARDASGVVVDPLDPDWTAGRQRVAADATFYPSEFSRLRAQVQADLPSWRDQPIYAAFLTLELSLGVHGAHKF